MKNWFNGLPGQGIIISANDSGVITYWFNGLPSEYVAAGGAPATIVKDLISEGIIVFPR